MKLTIGVVALAGALLMPGAHASSSQSAVQPRGYVAFRAASSIVVDGRLDEASWKSAPWSDAFVDIEGAAKPAPRHQTRVKMLWNEIYFYIAADLVEPHLWATLTEHDSVIFRDNDYEVFIDPNGDNH